MINDFHLVLSLQKLNHSHVENNGLQRNEIHEVNKNIYKMRSIRFRHYFTS